MKLKLSPLVAALHGRAADAVCAVTRGVQYVKKHARPGGPPTAAQLAHRAHVARLGDWWHQLPPAIRDFANILGNEINTTGFAVFSKACASQHSISYDPTILPDNHFFEPAPIFHAYPGMYPGDIWASWHLHNSDPAHWFHWFTALTKSEDIKDVESHWFKYHADKVTPLGNEVVILPGHELGLDYWVVGIAASKEKMADNTVFSGGRVDQSWPGPE